MSNYVLVCHGNIREFGSFHLAAKQEVQYRGNFGAKLGYMTALAVWKALKSDPTLDDKSLGKAIQNYHPEPVLAGPNSFAPDINLEGDDNRFLFLINMNTRNYILLKGDWKIKLSSLVDILGNQGTSGFWLNLLCCTEIPESGIEMPSGAHLVSSFEKIL
ncbi:hypothetical protein [Rhizobium leguminosarum]|uniref:hypothetical protein n=1 Tax=Rhizobium leguminosarum TaxID=384 RepID=UPI001AE4901B|nr:hypothetical protein [Rhizobium leguminosarum]MBP2449631.1 hypothetical protein [Rhizobium leguminosarum]